MRVTTEHIATIHRYLEGLGRRERRLLAGRASAWAGVVLSGWLILAAAAFSFGMTRGTVGLILAGVAVPLCVLLVFLLIVPRWNRSQSVRWQARCVEARLPGLRSRLITVVDRAEALAQDDPGFSKALFARAAAHATAATDLIKPGDVHRKQPLTRAMGALAAAILGLVIAGAWLPVGPGDVIAVLFGKSATAIRLADAVHQAEGDAAVVGDITLRYIYPDYTGLDSKTVPNSDGTIHAPPGTVIQISARTAETVDAAAIQVDQNLPIDSRVSGGRDLSAEITVNYDGQWRFLLFEGDTVTSSADYQILVEADAPPVVVISETGEKSVPVDRPIGLGWSVTDDYGIQRVSLSVTHDDVTTEHIRREPIDAVLELNGAERASPRDLGLSPGDKVVLRVVAMDNDKSNGGNIGESEPLVLTILGAQGYGRQLTRYHRRLLDALLNALADFLEEPVPAAESNAGMVAWASQARQRLEPIQALHQEQWGDDRSEAIDAVVVRRVMDASARLLRFTVVTFDIGPTSGVAGRRPVHQDVQTFATMHAETVEALEQAAWLVDSMLRTVAFQEVVRRAGQLAEEAVELADFAAENPGADALLARLDQLERLMDQLAAAASSLAEGQLREFVNDRISEATAQMNAIRKAISEGRLDDAQRMIAALAEQLKQFSEGLAEQMGRQGEGDDELARRFEQLMKDLDQLEADQEQLADEMSEARDELGDALDERMAAWEQLDVLAAEAVAHANALLTAVGDGAGWRAHSIERAERLGQVIRGLQNAIQARDGQGALERALDAQRYALMTERVIGIEANRRRVSTDPIPPRLVDAKHAGREVSRSLEKIRAVLEEMLSSPAQSNPALEQAARSLSRRQSALRERNGALEEEVQKVEQALPTGNGDAQQAIGGAGEAMDRANEALGQGDAMAGEGNQRDAARQIGNAKDNLQREMAEFQQMQRMQRRMSGEQGGEGGEGGDDQPSASMHQPEIPAPEAFRTPEEYRRSVLEGMAADVPEEFEALKKRFYEDLVRQ
jgi:hypothetical protein